MNEYSSCYVQIQRTLKLKIRKKSPVDVCKYYSCVDKIKRSNCRRQNAIITSE